MPAADRHRSSVSGCRTNWPVRDYDLDQTLDCGQAFRWTREGDAWVGVVAGRWVRLSHTSNIILAETAVPPLDWRWLADYLQVHENLPDILRTFPRDEAMQSAVAACRGLRLLRQDPWECLASFLLSATKQIVQIRQVIVSLCERYGEPLPVPAGRPRVFAFPSAARIAGLRESDLRQCRMGFRAPRLLAAAQAVADGRLDLRQVQSLPLEEARERLMRLDGVGPKIADCALLFGFGFPRAFPVDVWVERALRELYFGGRPTTPRTLDEFAARHFGPHAGYAQQYLFHFIRTGGQQKLSR